MEPEDLQIYDVWSVPICLAAKCPSLEPYGNAPFKVPFEKTLSEPFGLEQPFNTAARVVPPSKCLSEAGFYPIWNAEPDCQNATLHVRHTVDMLILRA